MAILESHKVSIIILKVFRNLFLNLTNKLFDVTNIWRRRRNFNFERVRVFAFPIFAFPFSFPNQNLPFVTDFWFLEIQSVAPLSVMFILFYFCPRFYNLKIFFPFLSHSTPCNHQLRHLFIRIFCDRHAPGMCFR